MGLVSNFLSAWKIPEFYNPNIVKTFSYLTIIASFNLVNYQFTFASLSIRERIRILSLNLSLYFPSSKEENDNSNLSIKLFALDSIMKMHDHLADAVLIVNNTFTLQVTFKVFKCSKFNYLIFFS